MFQARWSKIPVAGRLVRKVANVYAKKASSAYLLTLAEANEIVDESKGVALGPCTCRAVFSNCDNPLNTEIMVGLNRDIFIKERPQDYREITKQDAKDTLEQCHQRGLVHTILRCRQDFYAICNCCSCCCVPMRLKKEYGIGGALTRRDDITQMFKAGQLL